MRQSDRFARGRGAENRRGPESWEKGAGIGLHLIPLAAVVESATCLVQFLKL